MRFFSKALLVLTLVGFSILFGSCKESAIKGTLGGDQVSNPGGGNPGGGGEPGGSDPPSVYPTCAGTPTTLSTNMNANIVFGQDDFVSSSANKGGSVSASGLKIPDGAFGYGDKLFVADRVNHRLLIFNDLSDNVADVVLGQADFISGSPNRGGAVGANTISSSREVFYDGTYLMVSDVGNRRVLFWKGLPTVNGQDADFVWGQPDLVSNTINNGGISAQSLRLENFGTVHATANQVFVAEPDLNSRILIYDRPTEANFQAANVVVGQPDFTTTGWAASAVKYDEAADVYSDGTILIVADRYNDRVLIYNSIPTSNGAAADVVIGQPNLTSTGANQGGAPAANTLNEPHGVHYDGQKLYIADTLNNRVLIFNSLPTANDQPADMVIGQPDFVSNSANMGGPVGANTLNRPTDVDHNGCQLIITDQQNNRILIY